MTVEIALGIVAIAALASCLATVSGFGFALTAVPLLAMLLGAKDAVVLSAMIGWVSPLVLGVRLREHIRWSMLTPLVGAAMVGMPLGVLILDVIPVRGLRIAIAVVVAAATILLWRGWKIQRPTRAAEAFGGFISGLLNTSVGTSGPPVVVVMQARGLDPTPFRATVSAYFFLINVVGVSLFAGRGFVTRELLAEAVVAIPALGLGLPFGFALSRRVSVAQFRRVVSVLLLGAALSSAALALF